jgi:hypothetical protein
LHDILRREECKTTAIHCGSRHVRKTEESWSVEEKLLGSGSHTLLPFEVIRNLLLMVPVQKVQVVLRVSKLDAIFPVFTG